MSRRNPVYIKKTGRIRLHIPKSQYSIEFATFLTREEVLESLMQHYVFWEPTYPDAEIDPPPKLTPLDVCELVEQFETIKRKNKCE